MLFVTQRIILIKLLEMFFDYKKLEVKLTEACDEVHKDFLEKFNNDAGYLSAGGARLETFFTDLQKEFEGAAATFIRNNNLEKDTEGKKRVLTITKLYAKRCVEDYNKVS